MSTDQEAEGGSPLEPVPMQAVPPPERRTRAGRNLPAAIGVGLGLGVVILAIPVVGRDDEIVSAGRGGRDRLPGVCDGLGHFVFGGTSMACHVFSWLAVVARSACV